MQAKLLKLLEIYMEDRLALSSAGKADDIEPERFGTARVRVRACARECVRTMARTCGCVRSFAHEIDSVHARVRACTSVRAHGHACAYVRVRL